MNSMRHERALAVDHAVVSLNVSFVPLGMDGGSPGLAAIDHRVLHEYTRTLIRLERKIVVTCNATTSSNTISNTSPPACMNSC